MSVVSVGIVRGTRARGIAAAVVALCVLVVAAATSSATFSGPNGRILFTAGVEKTKGNEIFSATPNGKDVQQLTTSGNKHNSVIGDWSPDGQRIAFDSDRVDVDGLAADRAPAEGLPHRLVAEADAKRRDAGLREGP